MFFLQADAAQSQPVNMLPSCVRFSENTRAASIHPSLCFPSGLPPLSPPALPGGRQRPWGRATLTCRNRPCSAATPGALLISAFQFLASVRPLREVIGGRWGRRAETRLSKKGFERAGNTRALKLKWPRCVSKMLSCYF